MSETLIIVIAVIVESMQGEERRESSEAVVEFTQRLSKLKREGCNILLVGTEALSEGCVRLLGESEARPRRRLFVTTDAGSASVRAKLDSTGAHGSRNSAVVVDWDANTRSASAHGSGGRDVRVETVEGDFKTLGTTIESVVDEFDEEAGGLAPSELRLCFDSLTPLVAEHELRSVSRFLLGLTEIVERADGMAHYHLPADYDDATVEMLAPLFDAVVEVRHAEESVQQRWHLSDPDITTDWLTL